MMKLETAEGQDIASNESFHQNEHDELAAEYDSKTLL